MMNPVPKLCTPDFYKQMYDYSGPLICNEYEWKIALHFHKRSGEYNNQELVMTLQRSWI